MYVDNGHSKFVTVSVCKQLYGSRTHWDTFAIGYQHPGYIVHLFLVYPNKTNMGNICMLVGNTVNDFSCHYMVPTHTIPIRFVVFFASRFVRKNLLLLLIEI